MRIERKSTKDEIVEKLAQSYYRVDSGIIAIYRLLEEGENDPDKPIKLLAVNKNVTADGIRPVFFEPHSVSGFYSSVIIEMTEEELGSIVLKKLQLPNNWWIGKRIEQNG